MPQTVTLDLRGQVCPDPLIQVQDAIKRASSGDAFVVLVDYPLAVENISRWAESQGCTVNLEKKGNEWEIQIAKA